MSHTLLSPIVHSVLKKVYSSELGHQKLVNMSAFQEQETWKTVCISI